MVLQIGDCARETIYPPRKKTTALQNATHTHTHTHTKLTGYRFDQSLPKNVNVPRLDKNIPQALWSPSVHYGFHKSPPNDPTLSHINSFHILYSSFVKMHFSIILLFMPMSSRLQFSSSPTKTCSLSLHPHSYHIPSPLHHP